MLIYSSDIYGELNVEEKDEVAKMEEGGNAFKILSGKSTANRPLGRPSRRCEENIRIDL